MKCYIIAGPNGAGKTAFAKSFLPNEVNCLNFLNADLIAQGLAPFKPESMAFEAGRLLLNRIDELVSKREDFAFETTLSGLGYVRRIREWRSIGYSVVLYFLKLPSEEMAIERVHLRVAEGGHDVAEKTIRRRYHKGWENLNVHYKQLVDTWVIFDNSGKFPVILGEST